MGKILLKLVKEHRLQIMTSTPEEENIRTNIQRISKQNYKRKALKYMQNRKAGSGGIDAYQL